MALIFQKTAADRVRSAVNWQVFAPVWYTCHKETPVCMDKRSASLFLPRFEAERRWRKCGRKHFSFWYVQSLYCTFSPYMRDDRPAATVRSSVKTFDWTWELTVQRTAFPFNYIIAHFQVLSTCGNWHFSHVLLYLTRGNAVAHAVSNHCRRSDPLLPHGLWAEGGAAHEEESLWAFYLCGHCTVHFSRKCALTAWLVPKRSMTNNYWLREGLTAVHSVSL